MTNHLPVLIVGAGPTGLTLASELARRGIHFRIIDKKAEPTPYSNATWIQTRTLELFNHMGIVDRFLKKGNACDAINLYIDGKSLATIRLNTPKSFYPYVMMLSQCETEILLTQHLTQFGHQVERSLELIHLERNHDHITTTIRHPNGQIEIIVSDWLIACDGANSKVREQCQLAFPGEDIAEQFIVADALIDSFMSKKEIHVFFDEGTLFAAFPLGQNKFRITANLHLTHARKIFTEREVIEMAQERAHGAFYVKSVSWISPFWIHGKILNQMREGRIFFAGDAAHIHSPTGSQGMNTGIQDAYNLAWKLALVINHQATPRLLDSYHAERHPIVKNIIEQTDHYTKIALFDPTFVTKLRHLKQKLSNEQKALSKKIVNEITEVGIQYVNSPVIMTEKLAGKYLKPGTFAPDVALNHSAQFYDYLRNTQHHILLFTAACNKQKTLEKIISLQHALLQTYGELIKVYIITKENIPHVEHLILDSQGKIHEAYHVVNPIVYLLRPDNYIAYCSKKMELSLIKDFLKNYLS